MVTMVLTEYLLRQWIHLSIGLAFNYRYSVSLYVVSRVQTTTSMCDLHTAAKAIASYWLL